MLEELARQQQIVLRLMSGLGEQLNSLMAVRDESRSLIDQLAASERQADSLIRQNDLIVGDATRASLAKAQQIRQEILLRSAKSRPDWPALRQSLAEAIEDVSIARSQAEEEIKNFEQLNTEFEATRRTADRVYAFLASHQEDRLAANQHYQAAADALDRIAVMIQEPRGAAAAWLAQVRDAAGDLERSEQLAREDIRLAEQAQSEISECSVGHQPGPDIGLDGHLSRHRQCPGPAHPSRAASCDRKTTSSRFSAPAQPPRLARQLHYAADAASHARADGHRGRAKAPGCPTGEPRWATESASGPPRPPPPRPQSSSGTYRRHAPEPPEPEPATAGGSWGGETAQGNW